ncbi:DMT family transporter [Telmatobacter sp. DSM 110680]|uniref:DMT family transporter n=1 Tax=Telmatobacter sp. DSM 110680 TaxID=3036704 RepID=A0AAU7DQH1_9BACT
MLSAIGGFTCWVFADSIMKMVGRSALPAYQVIGFLGLFITGFLVAYTLARRDTSALWPQRPRRQLVRSSLDLINNLCVVVALRHVPLTLFYILVFMSPGVITILAAIFIREKPGLRKSLAIAIGFAGVVIAVNPFTSSRQGDWIGYAACMTCVACFSVNMVWSRILTQTESPESLTIFSGVVMAVAGFGSMLWHAEPLTLHLLLALVSMGAFGATGSICFFVALRHTTASNVSQYHYTQLVTGAVVSYLLFHELPTVWMFLGGALIVASGLYIAFLASRSHNIGQICETSSCSTLNTGR